MPERDGGPAFPQPVRIKDDPTWHRGILLRDYFAGQALAGAAGQQWYARHTKEEADARGISPEDYAAVACYRMADAMLAAKEAARG